MERVCKPGLLVADVIVKGFPNPWKILIDSGASGNYAQRSTMERSQLYARALKARTSDATAVRLATGTSVTVPKVAVNLGANFFDFDSVERCLVLDLDSRYDLILGMAWLERHEPWIDWRSKTLGATRLSSGGALASHEPTSTRKQKRYWRGHWTESVNVLDIGVSELMDTCVEDASLEHCSRADRGVARSPLSEIHRDKSSLHTGHGMVDNQSRHLGHGPSDARGAARNPLSGERLDGDEPLCANDGAVGCEPRHQGEDPDGAGGVAPNPLGGGCKHCSSSPAQSEQQGVETPENTFSVNLLASPRRTASARRRQRRQMATASRMASVLTQDMSVMDDDSEQLYTLVGVTGEAEGNVSLEAIPTVAALLELDEMSISEFGDALKAGELAEVVMIRPEEELNSSSVMDEAVLEDTKQALSTRSGASIMKNPSDPFYPLVKE
jgi:hypothetical protein